MQRHRFRSSRTYPECTLETARRLSDSLRAWYARFPRRPFYVFWAAFDSTLGDKGGFSRLGLCSAIYSPFGEPNFSEGCGLEYVGDPLVASCEAGGTRYLPSTHGRPAPIHYRNSALRGGGASSCLLRNSDRTSVVHFAIALSTMKRSILPASKLAQRALR